MAAYYLWCGLAQTTRKGYDSARNSYLSFCQLQRFHHTQAGGFRSADPQPGTASVMPGSSFPTTPLWLIEWIVSLAGKVKSRTLKLYLTGLKSYHVDLGLDTSAFEDTRLERVLRGIKREHPDGQRRERAPLIRPKLIRILQVLSRARYTTGACAVEGATLRAAFCLAFAAFLRIGEITYSPQDVQHPRAADFPKWFVTKRSVQIHTAQGGGHGSLSITLPASKTDPFRKSVTILVAGTGDIACPVKAMAQYLRHDQRPANSPLFVTPENLPFTREYLIRRLRTLALSAGLGAEVWNGHSFRRGAATWANLQGLPGDTIQLLGRWNSTAYKLYIDLAPEERIELSRRFQSLPGGQPPA
jgi:integrase